MRIDVLHIEDCPNWERAGRLLDDVLRELGIADVSVRFALIRTVADTARHPFAGSPTVLIDGVDVIPGATPTTDLACRVYWDGERPAGIPSRDTVRAAILNHLGPGQDVVK